MTKTITLAFELHDESRYSDDHIDNDERRFGIFQFDAAFLNQVVAVEATLRRLAQDGNAALTKDGAKLVRPQAVLGATFSEYEFDEFPASIRKPLRGKLVYEIPELEVLTAGLPEEAFDDHQVCVAALSSGGVELEFENRGSYSLEIEWPTKDIQEYSRRFTEDP